MATSDQLQLPILPRPPFAFDLALAYLRTSPSTIVETITADTYIRPLRLDGRAAILEVRGATAPGEPPSLEVTLRGQSLTAEDARTVETLVRRAFATDVDLAPLEVVAETDPVFAAVVRRCRGLRPVLIPDLFETIVWAILGQQITVTFAAKTKRALVERYGERVEHDGRSYLLFPTPAQLAEAREADLAAIQLSRQKIRYVQNVARQVATGALRLDELWTLPAEAAQARLEELVGIGRWTAEYVLMRGLGHPDAIPAADGGLRRAIGRAYGLGRSATEDEVRRLAAAWSGWRSYASFYWWFTLQQESRASL